MGFIQSYDVRSVIPKFGDGDFLTFHFSLLNAVKTAFLNDEDYVKQCLLRCNSFGGTLATLDASELQQVAKANVTLLALEISEEGSQYLDGSREVLQPSLLCKTTGVQESVNAQMMELIIRITELHLKSPPASIITYGVSLRNAKLLAATSLAKRKEIIIKGHAYLRPRINASWLTSWPETIPVELFLQ